MYIDLKRIEFIITYQCSGKCKHCSIGDKINEKAGEHIHYDKIKGAIKELKNSFAIKSIMCFGGEPLLYPDDVSGIIYEAQQCGIAKRQIITNGYFSKVNARIADVVYSLEEAEVTHVLLSVDAFHQETIPIEPVYHFAKQVKEGGLIDIKLHPAWLVNQENENEYNSKTSEIMKRFEALNLPISNGNNIFPAGNAIRNLADYYPKTEIDMDYTCGKAPYTSPLEKTDTISILPNGDVCICCFVIGNIYQEDIISILTRYNPYENVLMQKLMKNGVKGLIDYGNEYGITVDTSKHYSACGICRELVESLQMNIS